MAKKKQECPNCKGTGKFADDGEEKVCPCQALKE